MYRGQQTDCFYTSWRIAMTLIINELSMNENNNINSQKYFSDKSNDTTSSEFKTPIIIAYKLKSPHNIGFILRLAANSNSEKVIFVDDDFDFKNRKIKHTASNAFNSIDWKSCKPDELFNHIPTNYKIVAVETTSQSTDIYKTNLPEKCAIIVGNEKDGIDESILEKCDISIHIPMLGSTKSMNVSHALSVALFEWIRQNLY